MIERFPDIKIAMEACKVLSNLAVNDNNKIRISIEREINLIISAMKNHITLADVQKEAIKVLYNLSFLDENIITISREYGICVIIGVMKYHTDHANVQKEACRIICKLTFKNDENIAITLKEGGLEVMRRTKKKYIDYTCTYEKARRAILILTKQSLQREDSSKPSWKNSNLLQIRSSSQIIRK